MRTSPKDVLAARYSEDGRDEPVYGQITVWWAPSEDEGVETAHRIWPNAGLGGDLSQELALPLHFEQAAQTVTPEMIGESMPCGPDPDRYLDEVRAYADAGFDHIYFHQIGPDQQGFLRFWQEELRPRL